VAEDSVHQGDKALGVALTPYPITSQQERALHSYTKECIRVWEEWFFHIPKVTAVRQHKGFVKAHSNPPAVCR
jgi:hypothetical protein